MSDGTLSNSGLLRCLTAMTIRCMLRKNVKNLIRIYCLQLAALVCLVVVLFRANVFLLGLQPSSFTRRDFLDLLRLIGLCIEMVTISCTLFTISYRKDLFNAEAMYFVSMMIWTWILSLGIIYLIFETIYLA